MAEIDDMWDLLHTPSPAPPRTSGKIEHIQCFRGLRLEPKPHLVLGTTIEGLRFAIEKLWWEIDAFSLEKEITGPLPCLIYPQKHWQEIQQELAYIQASLSQAFIGTMDCFVIDCFYFHSAEDV